MSFGKPEMSTKVTAKITSGSLGFREDANLLGSYKKHILAWIVCHLLVLALVELFLNGFSLLHLKISFCCNINQLRVQIATGSQLDLDRPQMRVHIEVDESPMLEEGMQSNNATNVTRKIPSAYSRR